MEQADEISGMVSWNNSATNTKGQTISAQVEEDISHCGNRQPTQFNDDLDSNSRSSKADSELYCSPVLYDDTRPEFQASVTKDEYETWYENSINKTEGIKTECASLDGDAQSNIPSYHSHVLGSVIQPKPAKFEEQNIDFSSIYVKSEIVDNDYVDNTAISVDPGLEFSSLAYKSDNTSCDYESHCTEALDPILAQSSKAHHTVGTIDAKYEPIGDISESASSETVTQFSSKELQALPSYVRLVPEDGVTSDSAEPEVNHGTIDSDNSASDQPPTPSPKSAARQPKKRKFWSNYDKITIIEKVKSGRSQAHVSREHNMPAKTISNWLREEKNIRAAMEEPSGPFRKRIKTQVCNPDLDAALWTWFEGVRKRNIPVDGPTLLAKAKYFAKELGHDSFQGSHSWVKRWKDRHLLALKSLSGEAERVQEEVINNWRSTKLKKMFRKYKANDIFNADETALYYRAFPKKSFLTQLESEHGLKQDKERITILACCNMDGSEKLPLLVIGSAWKPKSFKHIKIDDLPVKYTANSKAWMNSFLFSNWVKELDRKMVKMNRKIVIVIDNCQAHTIISDLKSVELMFLSPSITSKTHPMEQGIINSLKARYKFHHLSNILKLVDLQKVPATRYPKIPIIDAIHYLHTAWEDVTPSIIRNCYRRAWLPNSKDADLAISLPQDSDDKENLEGDLPLSELKARGLDVDMTEEEFFSIDSTLNCVQPATDEEIVGGIQEKLKEKEFGVEYDSEEEEEEENPPVANTMVAEMITYLKRWLPQDRTTDFTIYQAVATIESEVMRRSQKAERLKKGAD